MTDRRSKAVSLAGKLQEGLRAVTAPVRLIWGDQDVTARYPDSFVRQLHAAGIACSFVTVPNAEYWAQYERADVVDDRLLTWFDGTPAEIKRAV